ncbi:hypothetical protein D3C85_665200 [compost metagenome]
MAAHSSPAADHAAPPGLSRRLQPAVSGRTPLSHGKVPSAPRASARFGVGRGLPRARAVSGGRPRPGPRPGLHRALPGRRAAAGRATPPRPAVERGAGATHGARGGRLAADRRAGPRPWPGLQPGRRHPPCPLRPSLRLLHLQRPGGDRPLPAGQRAGAPGADLRLRRAPGRRHRAPAGRLPRRGDRIVALRAQLSGQQGAQRLGHRPVGRHGRCRLPADGGRAARLPAADLPARPGAL